MEIDWKRRVEKAFSSWIASLRSCGESRSLRRTIKEVKDLRKEIIKDMCGRG